MMPVSDPSSPAVFFAAPGLLTCGAAGLGVRSLMMPRTSLGFMSPVERTTAKRRASWSSVMM